MNAHRAMKDWPACLRMSVAREMVAEKLYEARSVAYELGVPPWNSLTHETRERYREQAQFTIEAVKPQPRGLPPIALTGLRPVTGGRIVGAIEPQEDLAG